MVHKIRRSDTDKREIQYFNERKNTSENSAKMKPAIKKNKEEAQILMF